ncbi:MAG: hypothetical protein ABH852_05695 [Methanobacteriota archaeon]
MESLECAVSRCLAIRPHLKEWRCRNEAGDSFFCWQHKRWLLKVVIGILATIFIGLVVNFLWSRVSPPSSTETRTLELAEKTSDDVVAIRQMLENRNPENLEKLETYLKSEGLETTYGYGFALFYSDGRKTLHFGAIGKGVKFDPYAVKVTKYTSDTICFDSDPIQIQGTTINMTGNCFRRGSEGRFGIIKLGNVGVEVRRLADSSSGAVWVVGLTSN